MYAAVSMRPHRSLQSAFQLPRTLSHSSSPSRPAVPQRLYKSSAERSMATLANFKVPKVDNEPNVLASHL